MYQIILRPIGTRHSFATAAPVPDNVTRVAGVVLQLNREVVEPRLLIVETDVTVLVEVLNRGRRRLNWSRTGGGAVASRIETTYFHGCGNCLSSKPRHTDDDRRSPLTTRDGAGRNRPLCKS